MEKTQKVVVAGVIYQKSRFLLLQRSPDESIFPDKWELPSGKVEFGEDPHQALKREIKEETGLEIQKAEPLACTHYTIEKPDKMRHTIQIIYLILLNNAIINLKLSQEHQAYKWVFPKELKRLDAFDDIENILKKAEERIKWMSR